MWLAGGSLAAAPRGQIVEPRFRVILANGQEVRYAGVADVVAAFRAGQFPPSGLLFDARVGRWTPAIEHDAIVAATVQAGANVLPAAPKPALAQPVAPGLPTDLRALTVAEVAPAGQLEVDPRLDPSLAKLRGVGGWLAWFEGCCVGAAFLATLSVIDYWTGSTAADLEALSSVSPSANFMRTFETGALSAIAAGFLSVGLLLALRHSSAALFAVALLLAVLVYYLVDVWLAGVVYGELHAAIIRAGHTVPDAVLQDEQRGYARVGQAIVASLCWLLYLFKSKRVRATFGRVTWARLGLALVGRLPSAPAAAPAR